jgi:hypothetical protein
MDEFYDLNGAYLLIDCSTVEFEYMAKLCENASMYGLHTIMDGGLILRFRFNGKVRRVYGEVVS